MAKTSKTMLKSSGESGHPCFVPDFRGNAFNISPLRVMLAVGLSYIAFIMLRYVPSIPAFWRVLIINGIPFFMYLFSPGLIFLGPICLYGPTCVKARHLAALYV